MVSKISNNRLGWSFNFLMLHVMSDFITRQICSEWILLLPFMVCSFFDNDMSDMSEHFKNANILYLICRKWVPGISNFEKYKIHNYASRIIFERRHLISVYCIVLLERLPVTRQRLLLGGNNGSLTPYGQVPGNMHGQTLHRYPALTLTSCTLLSPTDNWHGGWHTNIS